MMKRLCFGKMLVFLLIACGKLGFAYTVDEIFHKFKAAYETSRSFSAEFEETTLQDGNKSIASGRLVFSKPNLLRKEYLSREDPTQTVQLIILDGDHSWSYTPMLNQVNKMRWNNPDRKELLPGIGATLEDVQENYDMSLVPDPTANKKGVYQIELTPKPHMLTQPVDETRPARETLEVWVQSSDWLPVQFGYRSEREDRSALSVTVSLKKIRRDEKVAPDAFKFVIPDDVEVIDLSSDE
jgi:outer membrane lipoprotein-sorting protein